MGLTAPKQITGTHIPTPKKKKKNATGETGNSSQLGETQLFSSVHTISPRVNNLAAHPASRRWGFSGFFWGKKPSPWLRPAETLPPRVKWHATRGGRETAGKITTKSDWAAASLNTGRFNWARQEIAGEGLGGCCRAGGSGQHPSVGVPGTGGAVGGRGSPSLYVAVCLSPFPLDFPHKQSKQSQSRPSVSGS